MKRITNKIKKAVHYVHKEVVIGWFRVSFYKLGKKFTLRFEIAKGWE